MSLGYGGGFVIPSGSADATWAAHGGEDPSVLLWRKAQFNRAKRAGWIRQPDGSYVPPPPKEKKRRRPIMMLGEEFDGIPTAYPLGLNGCGDGLPNEYCEGYQFQSGGMGDIPFIDDCPRPGVPYCGMGDYDAKNVGFFAAAILGGALLGYSLSGKKASGACFGAAAGVGVWWGMTPRPSGFFASPRGGK